MKFKITSPSWRFINNVVNQLFKDKLNGFFIEAGALDGEFLSNTLYIEQANNWTGLLIEADDDNFNQLKSKNRKAWLANSCIGTKSYPYHTILAKANPFSNDANWSNKGGSRLSVS